MGVRAAKEKKQAKEAKKEKKVEQKATGKAPKPKAAKAAAAPKAPKMKTAGGGKKRYRLAGAMKGRPAEKRFFSTMAGGEREKRHIFCDSIDRVELRSWIEFVAKK